MLQDQMPHLAKQIRKDGIASITYHMAGPLLDMALYNCILHAETTMQRVI